jgi:hypothetical protein
MHLAALNILDLMISLRHGMMDCTKPDDRSTWTWAVLPPKTATRVDKTQELLGAQVESR